MQGTVVVLKPNGVVAKLDGLPQVGDIFQIYRIQDGNEVVLATGYARKPKGEFYKINPLDAETGGRGMPFVGIQEGDLIRSV